MRRTEQLQELRLSGMMLHQDGPTHQWVPEQWWDLIVTIANHLAWAKKPCHFQTSGKTKISMLSPNFINLSRSLNFRRPGPTGRRKGQGRDGEIKGS